MRNIGKITRGAPDIIKLADRHSSSTDARTFADGRKIPTRTLEQPIAKSAGQITSFDYWSVDVTSVLGHHGVYAGIDNYSGHFRLFPITSKTFLPEATHRYYLEARRDGVNIDPGSVFYSDNEAANKSQRLFKILDQHDIIHEFSAEYEPWGNGGIESVFRYVPVYIISALIRGGAPKAFWVFAALDAEEVLNITRERNGTSVRELWCGKPGNISRRRVLFCRVIMRKPIPWRDGKLDDRQMNCVYLGKARNKQGYYGWNEKYGLVKR